MVGRAEPIEARHRILSSLSEIFSDMERVINYIVAKRRQDAMWSAALIGIWVSFVGIAGLFVVNELTDMYVTEYFIDHPAIAPVFLGFLLMLSITIGLIAYSYLKRQRTEEFVPWKTTLDRLRKAIADNKGRERVSIVEKTLQLMDQTSAWLPYLVKYKSGEAFTYGFLAWLLAGWTLPSPIGIPIGLLVGVMIWLYFRYEKRKEADQQIRKLETWKQKLEEGESNFLVRV